jgi:hypothetical protein
MLSNIAREGPTTVFGTHCDKKFPKLQQENHSHSDHRKNTKSCMIGYHIANGLIEVNMIVAIKTSTTQHETLRTFRLGRRSNRFRDISKARDISTLENHA